MSQAVLLEPSKRTNRLGSVLLGTASHRAGNKVLCEEVGFDKSQIKQKEAPKKQFGGGFSFSFRDKQTWGPLYNIWM